MHPDQVRDISEIQSLLQNIEVRLTVKAAVSVLEKIESFDEKACVFLFRSLEGFLQSATSSAVKVSGLSKIVGGALIKGIDTIARSNADGDLPAAVVNSAVALLSRLPHPECEAVLREVLVMYSFVDISVADEAANSAWRNNSAMMRKILVGAQLVEKMGETFHDAATDFFPMFFDSLLVILVTLSRKPQSKRGRQSENPEGPSMASVSTSLVLSVLSIVRNLASYDSGGAFLTNGGNGLLGRACNAVVAQIGNVHVLNSQHVQGSVIPTIEHLALCAGHGAAEGWRQVQTACIALCTGESSEVRRNALRAILRVYERVGERMGVLLRELVGPLANLVEDSDPTVATLARDIVRDLSKITGESIDNFMR
jgi:hypothetical protein